ncbi:MAG: hypothetical protein LQ352_003933 [Teloschistes flavicans]|nr:MAG: hypothetical protein LQ352_003933 [Teloschistes flavicans]
MFTYSWPDAWRCGSRKGLYRGPYPWWEKSWDIFEPEDPTCREYFHAVIHGLKRRFVNRGIKRIHQMVFLVEDEVRNGTQAATTTPASEGFAHLSPAQVGMPYPTATPARQWRGIAMADNRADRPDLRWVFWWIFVCVFLPLLFFLLYRLELWVMRRMGRLGGDDDDDNGDGGPPPNRRQRRAAKKAAARDLKARRRGRLGRGNGTGNGAITLPVTLERTLPSPSWFLPSPRRTAPPALGSSRRTLSSEGMGRGTCSSSDEEQPSQTSDASGSEDWGLDINDDDASPGTGSADELEQLIRALDTEQAAELLALFSATIRRRSSVHTRAQTRVSPLSFTNGVITFVSLVVYGLLAWYAYLWWLNGQQSANTTVAASRESALEGLRSLTELAGLLVLRSRASLSALPQRLSSGLSILSAWLLLLLETMQGTISESISFLSALPQRLSPGLSILSTWLLLLLETMQDPIREYIRFWLGFIGCLLLVHRFVIFLPVHPLPSRDVLGSAAIIIGRVVSRLLAKPFIGIWSVATSAIDRTVRWGMEIYLWYFHDLFAKITQAEEAAAAANRKAAQADQKSLEITDKFVAYKKDSAATIIKLENNLVKFEHDASLYQRQQRRDQGSQPKPASQQPSWETENAKLLKEVTTLQSKNKKQASDLKRFEAASQDREDSDKTAKTGHEAELRQLQDSMASLERENEDLRKAKADHEQQSEETEAELRDELEQSKSSITSLELAVGLLEKELSDHAETVTGLKQELEKAKPALEDAQSQQKPSGTTDSPEDKPKPEPKHKRTAQEHCDSSFPDGWISVPTSSNSFRCGIFAIITSMIYMDLASPTEKELMEIYWRDGIQARFWMHLEDGETPNGEYIRGDQLGVMLQTWGDEHNMNLVLGHVTGHPSSPPYLYGEVEGPDPILVWIYNNGYDGPLAHWEGVTRK